MKQILSFIALTLVVFVPNAFAQEEVPGVAVYHDIREKTVDGDIISFSNDGYVRSNKPYDPTIFGVVSDNPSVALEETGLSANAKAIMRTGKAYVRVSSRNGNISAGNLITSSKDPGIGQKASQEGFVVGTALESYSSSNPERSGKILVSLNMGFNSQPAELRSNLLSNFQSAIQSPILSPVNSLRYLVAGLAVILAFAISITFFGRVTSRGVEAIGRNPLAGKAIIFSIILNLVLTLGIPAVGIGISYLILIL